jgi:hypothetical protein
MELLYKGNFSAKIMCRNILNQRIPNLFFSLEEHHNGYFQVHGETEIFFFSVKIYQIITISLAELYSSQIQNNSAKHFVNFIPMASQSAGGPYLSSDLRLSAKLVTTFAWSTQRIPTVVTSIF